MNTKLKAYAGNLIFSLNILILFLLFYDDQLIIPDWLQSVGRLHPMFLHFPIAILFLAFILEYFRFNEKFRSQEFYAKFTDALLLGGILSAGITVVMGLILSVEDAYEGEQLEWHKWFGVSLVFISAVFYVLRNSKFYNLVYAKAGTVILSLLLIMAGHFGAVLTHGENFVMEPVSTRASVSLEEALVYDHVIQPVFQEKCISCHNDQKLKGSLKMTDTLSILKGGKSGKLFIAGKPDLSLLLERIHLPLGAKKHMPPSGKPQLTEEESRMLYLWVKSQSDFKQKVTDLPLTDSLRILAASSLKPADPDEQYDFAAADEKTVRKLNNFYRRIESVAQGSPALSVSFFNKAAYSAASLEELSAIKKQIVSLRLSRMPVKDAELKLISSFKNLEKLDLNFTDISSKGISALKGLDNLKVLSLSGTAVKFFDLQSMFAGKNLKEITIWNTGISDSEIKQLKQQYPNINFISGYKDDGSSMIQLSKPVLKNNGRVFSDQLAVNLYHPRKSIAIRYTLDGSEPDSIKSPVYNGNLLIKESLVLKTKAFKEGWKSSETAVFTLFRSIKPDQISLMKAPNENYRAAGANSLFDAQLADIDPNNNNWLGFMENDLVLNLNFKQPKNIRKVGLNTLISTGSSVFPAQSIHVYGGTDEKSLSLLGILRPAMPGKEDKPGIKNLEVTLRNKTVSCLKIVAKPLIKIPSWHASKGKPALMLVDEVLIN